MIELFVSAYTVFIRIEPPGTKTKFWQGASSKKKSKYQTIVGAAYGKNLDYEPANPGHWTF